MTQPQSLQLPDTVVLSLTAQDAVTILGVLQNSDGPYKAVSSVINAVQQQLMAQAKKPPSAPSDLVYPSPVTEAEVGF